MPLSMSIPELDFPGVRERNLEFDAPLPLNPISSNHGKLTFLESIYIKNKFVFIMNFD